MPTKLLSSSWNNHILALEMIKEKWDPPFRFLRRDGTIPRGTYVDDTCKLADIFMDETSKYYKGNAIHFGVICVAAEIIIDSAIMAAPSYWQSHGIMIIYRL